MPLVKYALHKFPFEIFQMNSGILVWLQMQVGSNKVIEEDNLRKDCNRGIILRRTIHISKNQCLKPGIYRWTVATGDCSRCMNVCGQNRDGFVLLRQHQNMEKDDDDVPALSQTAYPQINTFFKKSMENN